MIYKTKKPKKRPYWASPHVWDRTTGIVTITVFGVSYQLPVTPETAPFIAIMDGDLDVWVGFKRRRSEWRRQEFGADGMRMIINILCPQIEAIAVAAAARSLGQEISDRLEPLIEGKLHQRATEIKAALPAPNGNNAKG